MPVPQRLGRDACKKSGGLMGRSDQMGRGPYEKSGLIEDTGLPPAKPIHERFEILYPVEEVEENGKFISKPLVHDLDIEVKLWYLPFGMMDFDSFLWREFNKTVSITLQGG
jgi:hypothetical protein